MSLKTVTGKFMKKCQGRFSPDIFLSHLLPAAHPTAGCPPAYILPPLFHALLHSPFPPASVPSRNRTRSLPHPFPSLSQKPSSHRILPSFLYSGLTPALPLASYLLLRVYPSGLLSHPLLSAQHPQAPPASPRHFRPGRHPA